jgi:hypothetical protein
MLLRRSGHAEVKVDYGNGSRPHTRNAAGVAESLSPHPKQRGHYLCGESGNDGIIKVAVDLAGFTLAQAVYLIVLLGNVAFVLEFRLDRGHDTFAWLRPKLLE